jgi:hypothetical protein
VSSDRLQQPERPDPDWQIRLETSRSAVTPEGARAFTSSMDSIGPAPTGPLPEAIDLSDDDVEQLLIGAGGPTAWYEIAELLDRIRMEAAVEPDDQWVRTHVAVAAAAARKANLVPDPTAGRPSRPLRIGAVAAATTTLMATMGLAAADTLPPPLQSVAAQVASLVGVSVPDGHDRDAPVVHLPPPTTPDPSGGAPTTPATTGGPTTRERPAVPGAGPEPVPPPPEGGTTGTARVPAWFPGRSGWLSDWRRDLDRFERRDTLPRPLSRPGYSVPARPVLPRGPSATDSGPTVESASLPEIIERWTPERLRPYLDPSYRPAAPSGPGAGAGGETADQAEIAALPPLPRRRLPLRPPPPPAPPTTARDGAPATDPLPRRPGSRAGTGRSVTPVTDPATLRP